MEFMTTVTTSDSQHRNIQIYFLAAPEDQSVCEDVVKHLKPIIRNSAIPVDLISDFNIPSGADREQYKQRLFDADIVLALISVDFIDSDDIYNRNQKVIERYNNHQTVMIPILVRNCMWKATPFSSLPMVPKNLQPLNNKQFWNSQDDAVMAVVSDIYDSINGLAQTQREAAQPLPVAEVKSTPVLETPVETVISQPEPSDAVNELAQAISEAVQSAPVPEVEHVPDLETPVERAISQPEPLKAVSVPPQAAQPAPVAKVESAPVLTAVPGTS